MYTRYEVEAHSDGRFAIVKTMYGHYTGTEGYTWSTKELAQKACDIKNARARKQFENNPQVKAAVAARERLIASY